VVAVANVSDANTVVAGDGADLEVVTVVVAMFFPICFSNQCSLGVTPQAARRGRDTQG